jgi:integrase
LTAPKGFPGQARIEAAAMAREERFQKWVQTWMPTAEQAAEEQRLLKAGEHDKISALRREIYEEYLENTRRAQKNKRGYQLKRTSVKGIFKCPGSEWEWRVPYRVNGKQHVQKFVKGKEGWADAKEFRAERLRLAARKEAGLKPTIKDKKKVLLSDLLIWYTRTYLPGLKNQQRLLNETGVIADCSRFLLFSWPVIDIKQEDVYAWMQALKDEGKAPTSIARYKTIFCSAVKLALNRNSEWQELELPNPFAGKSIDGLKEYDEARDRVLEKGELSKLLVECDKFNGLNKIYVPLAIFLGLETGMRKQEICNLKWDDINFNERTINITKSKTKAGIRLIPMPYWTREVLYGMANAIGVGINENGLFDSNQLIFTETTKEKKYFFTGRKYAFRQAFDDVRDRALGVEPDLRKRLIFKDLRRTFAARLRKGRALEEYELAKMIGHKQKNMLTQHYTPIEMETVLNRLDIYTLKTMPDCVVDQVSDNYKEFIVMAEYTKDEKKQREFIDKAFACLPSMSFSSRKKMEDLLYNRGRFQLINREVREYKKPAKANSDLSHIVEFIKERAIDY